MSFGLCSVKLCDLKIKIIAEYSFKFNRYYYLMILFFSASSSGKPNSVYTDLISSMKPLYSENTPSESEAESESENLEFSRLFVKGVHKNLQLLNVLLYFNKQTARRLYLLLSLLAIRKKEDLK